MKLRMKLQNEICLDKNNEVLQNEVHMNKYGVEEKVKDNGVIIEKSLQDKMSGHYLDHYHNKDISFISSYIKFTSKTWKGKRYLNVGKRIKIFRQFSDGFIDFNLWKKKCIDVCFHSKYSKPDNKTRRLIMNDLMNELSGKVIRVVDLKKQSSWLTKKIATVFKWYSKIM